MFPTDKNLAKFNGLDPQPWQDFQAIEVGANILCVVVTTADQLFFVRNLQAKAEKQLIKLRDNDGLIAMLKSEKFRLYRKNLTTLERKDIRAAFVIGAELKVYTDDDNVRLKASYANHDVARFIAERVMPEYEVLKQPPEVTKNIFSSGETVHPGLWTLYRLPGYTTDNFPRAVTESVEYQEGSQQTTEPQDDVVDAPQDAVIATQQDDAVVAPEDDVVDAPQDAVVAPKDDVVDAPQDAVVVADPQDDVVVEAPQEAVIAAPATTKRVSFGLDDIDGLTEETISYGECDVDSLGLPEASGLFPAEHPLVGHMHKWASGFTRPAKIVLQVVDVNGTGEGTWNRGAVYSHDKQIFPFRIVGKNANTWLAAARGRFQEASTQLDIHSPGNYGSAGSDADTEFNPGWFKNNVPEDVFRADEREDEKAAYMREAIAAAGPEPEFDAEKLSAAWEAVRTVIDKEPQPGASSAEIDAFTRETGVPMPQELRALLGLVNGCEGVFNGRMLSVKQMIKEWGTWNSVFEQWSLAELTDFDSDRGVRGIYTNPRWIPVSGDWAGNNWFIDLVPTADGSVGQVICSGADYQEASFVAGSLLELLQEELWRQEERNEG